MERQIDMIILPFELAAVVDDMHRAKDAKLYYPALLVALTLPEICSGLTLPKNRFVKQTDYEKFVNTYSKPNELGDDGAGIYRLRGGLVHRGDMRGHPHYEASHVLFTIPDTGAKLHAFSIEANGKTAAMFDLSTFIDAMHTAVCRWYAANATNPQLKENLPHLIRYSHNGVAPFTQGFPAVVSGE